VETPRRRRDNRRGRSEDRARSEPGGGI